MLVPRKSRVIVITNKSNRAKVEEIARVGERFDSTAPHREDTTALRPHERWDLTV